MTGAALKYSRTAMGLHWVIALLLVYNHALGERTEHMERGPALFAVFQMHKSIGITILLLSLWRLWARIRHPRPAPVADSRWAKRLSSFVHSGFYVVMIGAPLTGWIIVSTSKTKIPTLLFGTIPWPHLPLGSAGRVLHEIAEEAHGALATIAIGLLVLHVVGALRHQFIMRDGLVDRMMPVSRAGIGAVALAFAALGGGYALGKVGPIPGMAAAAPLATSAAIAPVLAAPAAPAETRTEAVVAQVSEKAKEERKEEAVEAAKPESGPVPVWTMNPGGQLGFAVTVNGDKVAGRFDRWTADIAFDPERLDQSSIKASIDLASVGSGDSQRDEMLGGEDFFATSANRSAKFVATDIRAKGPGRYEARGTLSLKGVSRPVRLDFGLVIKGQAASAKGTASFDRGQFGVGSSQFSGDETISKMVAINFDFGARTATR